MSPSLGGTAEVLPFKKKKKQLQKKKKNGGREEADKVTRGGGGEFHLPLHALQTESKKLELLLIQLIGGATHLEKKNGKTKQARKSPDFTDRAAVPPSVFRERQKHVGVTGHSLLTLARQP